jgi:hypothetical protein
MNHLNEDLIAALIDGRVETKERTACLSHANECRPCRDLLIDTAEAVAGFEACKAANTLQEAPAKSLDAKATDAMARLFADLRDIGGMVVDFTRQAGERGRAFIWSVIDTLSLPEVNIAVRGDTAATRDQGVQMRRRFDRFDVSVGVSRLYSGNANIDVSVLDTTKAGLPEMRAALLIDGREVDSVSLLEGKADFTEIVMGNYEVRIWDKAGEELRFSLAMKG